MANLFVKRRHLYFYLLLTKPLQNLRYGFPEEPLGQLNRLLTGRLFQSFLIQTGRLCWMRITSCSPATTGGAIRILLVEIVLSSTVSSISGLGGTATGKMVFLSQANLQNIYYFGKIVSLLPDSHVCLTMYQCNIPPYSHLLSNVPGPDLT